MPCGLLLGFVVLLGVGFCVGLRWCLALSFDC